MRYLQAADQSQTAGAPGRHHRFHQEDTPMINRISKAMDERDQGFT